MLENSNIEERVGEIERVVKENNQMLKKMRRSQIMSSIFRAIYWLIILGGGVAVYYYLSPALEQLLKFYVGLGDQFSNFKNLLQ